jgi:hypothetical protein
MGFHDLRASIQKMRAEMEAKTAELTSLSSEKLQQTGTSI